MEEAHELKISGFTPREVYNEIKCRLIKVFTEKTIRKYYNMDIAPRRQPCQR